MYMHNNHCHLVTAQLQLNMLLLLLLLLLLWFSLPHIILVTLCFIFTFFVPYFAVFLVFLVCPPPTRHLQRLYCPGICLSLNTD